MRRIRRAWLATALAAGCAGCAGNSREPFGGIDGAADSGAPDSSSSQAPPDPAPTFPPVQDRHADAGPQDAGVVPGDAGVLGDATILADATIPGDATTLLDATAGEPTDASECGDAGDLPRELRCTGLYSDWASRTVAPAARPYAPGIVLWSDGAEKSRWIDLPAQSRIDTSDMDEWQFPVDTKFWKEFRLAGRAVETRFLWKRGPAQWFRTTYVWSADGSSATELTTGMTHVGGTSYEIPTQPQCTTCHQGRIDGVLGFEAVSLAAPGATGLTLATLINEGLLTQPPSAPLVIPGSDSERAALGWLHANCGTACHNRSPSALAGTTGLYMRLDVERMATVQGTDTWTTAVGQPSNFQKFPGSGLLLIDPGKPDNSAIYFRDSFRDTQGQDFQMPPIDTHAVDDAGVASVRAWITAM